MATQSVLSLTIFCWAALSSSPSRTLLSESATFEPAASQAALSFARSSACCTRASRVPILNEGIGNGSVSPLSRPTVAASAVKGSSSKILRGSETRVYWVGCIVGYRSMPRGGLLCSASGDMDTTWYLAKSNGLGVRECWAKPDVDPAAAGRGSRRRGRWWAVPELQGVSQDRNARTKWGFSDAG